MHWRKDWSHTLFQSWIFELEQPTAADLTLRLSLPVREIWEPRMQMGSCTYIPHSFSQQIQDLQVCSWHVQSCCSLIVSVVLSVSKQTTKLQYNAQAEGSILRTTWSTIWNSTSFLAIMKLERSTLLCICSSYSICQYLKSSSNINVVILCWWLFQSLTPT
jgi:hypothetical protein